MPAMADWRQIQARIRKAKNSPDAHAKLSELYQRTHDGMVAWELALIQEKAEIADEAVKWYTVAAEKFRRAEWKKKAEEALTRLGAALPAGSAISMDAGVNTEEPLNTISDTSDEEQAAAPLAPGEIRESDDEGLSSESPAKISAASESDDPAKKKRRRGRRGGRGRRRKGAGTAPGLPSQAFAETSVPSSVVPTRQQAPRAPAPRTPVQERAPAAYEPAVIPHEPPERLRAEHAAPMLPSERTAHGRAGDPALASRMSHLESMLRRLVASPLHRLDTEDAPAGPGVFLLSDSDQITSYYVEACQTLRVGVGNLVRGTRGSGAKTTRGSRPSFDSGLKSKLAEHLGITEAKVSQYLKDHCVVRWIQMDDDAPHLAHFAIGVLRTPLNLD
ncbi:MAG: hypothetical protein ABSF40_00785 [Candidatus Acidiferrales bacterium]|jgi:hypothetical protein